MKNHLLLIAALCILTGMVKAQNLLYDNDFSTAPTVTGSTHFTYGHTEGHWTITASGHDEWESFRINFPAEINFATAGNLPIVQFRAKSTENALFAFTLIDWQDRSTDAIFNSADPSNRHEIPGDGSYVEGTADFTGYFDNLYGDAGSPMGEVDSTRIVGIVFTINAGCYSQPFTGTLQTYDDSFGADAGPSTLSVDHLRVGGLPLSVSGTSVIASSVLFPNPSNGQTFTEFNLKEGSDVKIIITDMTGRQLDVVLEGKLNAGTHTSEFNVSNYVNGVYYVNYYINNEPSKMQMLMVK